MLKKVLVALAATLAIAVAPIAYAHSGGSEHNHRQRSGEKGSQSNQVSGLDREWLKMSIQGDVFEIQGGKIALQKSSNSAVRTLAQTLITDHTKALADALAVAKKLGIDVQQEPTHSQQWELKIVSSFSGAQFDSWYSQLEVADHQDDIQETTDEIQMGSNEDVINDAKEDLPILQKHLQLAETAVNATK